MISTFKASVKRNFSRSSLQYDEEALVQKQCARRLMTFSDQFLPLIPPGPCLEIGCGTGFVTLEIVKRLTNVPFHVTDISPSMVALCKNKIEALGLDNSHHIYRTLDGESLEDDRDYNLIISGLTFQWFQHFETSFRLLIDRLNPRGLLFFSFVERKSFPEWQLMCQDLKLPFNCQQLPSMSMLQRAIKSLPIVSLIREEPVHVIYRDPLDFFRNLKRIGACTSSSSTIFTHKQMGSLLKNWSLCYPQGIISTYQIVYGVIQKNSS